MAKIVGSEIVAFFESEWPEDWYVDDSQFSVFEGKIIRDDEELGAGLPLSEKYELTDFGFLCGPEGVPEIGTAFRRWKKAQTTETIIVDVPKEAVEEALALFEKHSYKAKKA